MKRLLILGVLVILAIVLSGCEESASSNYENTRERIILSSEDKIDQNLNLETETDGEAKPCSSCVKVAYLHYNAAGDDCYNLNDEYVTSRTTARIRVISAGGECRTNPQEAPMCFLN